MDRELYIILALCTQTGGKVLYNDKDVNWCTVTGDSGKVKKHVNMTGTV